LGKRDKKLANNVGDQILKNFATIQVSTKPQTTFIQEKNPGTNFIVWAIPARAGVGIRKVLLFTGVRNPNHSARGNTYINIQ